MSDLGHRRAMKSGRPAAEHARLNKIRQGRAWIERTRVSVHAEWYRLHVPHKLILCVGGIGVLTDPN
jgi:hypothetical protein